MDTYKDITSLDDLSRILKTPKKKLTFVLYIKKAENSYTSFKIPKKSGGERVINAPSNDLKDIQRNIVKMLLKQQRVFLFENNIKSNIAHAFTEDKSIITNAKVHKNKRFVLNLDLENFFESFHFGRVKGYFEKNKNYLFPENIATVLAQLTCYNGSLPQGAPSSPIITNLICNILDMKLLKTAKKYKLDYTRYADDLTFSTNNKNFADQLEEFTKQLEVIIKQSGFKINEKKTRLQYKQSRQVVTGLVVNKKVNVKKDFYKDTRAMVNSLYKNGSFTINDSEGSLNQLEGRFSFINHINKESNKERKKIDKNLKLNFRNLNGKEKEYQKFLFYKYFLSNKNPCILTEGPTDITYLKSALKNLYTDYPNLIEKVDENFHFKISFLKRTKKMKYFFDLEEEGADTMKKIYNFYTVNKEKNDCPNYSEIFKNINVLPKNPLIFILDNELANDNKPLKNLVNYMALKKEKIHELQTKNYINVTSNLYIVTNQLADNVKECEIEDLFDAETLDAKLNGKTFERDKTKYTDAANYGKKAFASYIWKNYKDINFENFRPLLDCINLIAKDYID
ncbi:retron Ec67 family RNA-directed DNA polymerase/endonuclease [Metasolibacillus meyeri]|uniref:retron Ec67 family RNA-directed DNA polymerase/endonuclease n=1 Tax=Metasolibacillus meyeri TaxID=1071052 RepID=UPI000D30DED6|nr:retron Ec67 family RNA-directed DNA polymerase/endonuclease [Metasolibacillus meyeri]